MGTVGMESNTDNYQNTYDREQEIKAFDDSKAGVKGVVDSGLKSLPKMFIRPSDELSEELNTPCVKLQVPVINMEGIDKKDRYEEIVKEVLAASEKWGFFQVVNHGIPTQLLDKMIQGIRMFHEQDVEVKKQFYSREFRRQVVFDSNYDLYKSRAANWRDTLSVDTSNHFGHLDPNKLPEICRDVIVDYTENALKLGDTLLEILSVALGLRPDFFKEEMEGSRGYSLVNHYYPACPAPELTLGTGKHSDPSFLTILLQDGIGGLQVLHENQWVDVQPIPGALVLNIGDVLQILSNDKLQSVYHRVTANRVGPRISAALFIKGTLSSPKLYGPIKEMLSEENPPLYKEFTLGDFHAHFFNRPLNEPGLTYWKVANHGDGKVATELVKLPQ